MCLGRRLTSISLVVPCSLAAFELSRDEPKFLTLAVAAMLSGMVRVLLCAAVCCSVLQCVTVCCSVLQCVEVCVAMCCSVLQCDAV